MRFLVDA